MFCSIALFVMKIYPKKNPKVLVLKIKSKKMPRFKKSHGWQIYQIFNMPECGKNTTETVNSLPEVEMKGLRPSPPNEWNSRWRPGANSGYNSMTRITNTILSPSIPNP